MFVLHKMRKISFLIQLVHPSSALLDFAIFLWPRKCNILSSCRIPTMLDTVPCYFSWLHTMLVRRVLERSHPDMEHK